MLWIVDSVWWDTEKHGFLFLPTAWALFSLCLRDRLEFYLFSPQAHFLLRRWFSMHKMQNFKTQEFLLVNRSWGFRLILVILENKTRTLKGPGLWRLLISDLSVNRGIQEEAEQPFAEDTWEKVYTSQRFDAFKLSPSSRVCLTWKVWCLLREGAESVIFGNKLTQHWAGNLFVPPALLFTLPGGWQIMSYYP